MNRHIQMWMMLLLFVLGTTGCRAITSAMQENQNREYDHVVTVDGVQLQMDVRMSRLVDANASSDKIDLNGTILVAAKNGPMPENLTLYHIALRPSESGYYVQNFYRNKQGVWDYPAPNQVTRSFHAHLQRRADEMAVTFQLVIPPNLFSWMKDQSAYESMDVTVTLVDGNDQKHSLTLLAQPVQLQKR